MSFRSSGETAVVAMAVGSVLVVMCALSIALAIQRRRRRLNQGSRTQRRSNVLTGSEGSQILVESRMDFQPTDFMKNLASWDRCHPIDEEALEKRRRAVWTLELFENHGIKDSTHNGLDTSAVVLQQC